jgi:hypothetical protein
MATGSALNIVINLHGESRHILLIYLVMGLVIGLICIIYILTPNLTGKYRSPIHCDLSTY